MAIETSNEVKRCKGGMPPSSRREGTPRFRGGCVCADPAIRLAGAARRPFEVHHLSMPAPKLERMIAFMLGGERKRGGIVGRLIFGEADNVSAEAVEKIKTVKRHDVPPDSWREREPWSLRR